MLELRRILAAVIGCFAAPGELDAVAVEGTLPIRSAPDELLLVSRPAGSAAVVAAAEAALERDQDSLVLDVSDGFGLCSLSGDWREAFARLCAIPAPAAAGCIQGLFADVPAKLVIGQSELLIVSSSVVTHHVEERVLRACGDLEPATREPSPLELPLQAAVA